MSAPHPRPDCPTHRRAHGLPLLAGLFGLLLPLATPADPVVIAHATSGTERLSREEIANIFLGRFRQYPSGQSAVPVDMPGGHPAKASFYRLLVSKEPAEINSYWARLVFSGRTVPPRVVSSTEEMLQVVATVPGAIGYLPRPPTDHRVRVVLDLGGP